MSTLVGEPDFTGGEAVTLSEGGPGRLVAVMKCSECGWSYRLLSYAPERIYNWLDQPLVRSDVLKRERKAKRSAEPTQTNEPLPFTR